MQANKTNLYDLDHESLISFLAQKDIKKFHANQIIKWLHRHFVKDFDQMTDLSKSLRNYLKENTHEPVNNTYNKDLIEPKSQLEFSLCNEGSAIFY